MTPLVFALLVLAGVGGGIMGYLTGLASLVTYPALVAAGLGPVSANASNTLGVLFIGVGSSISAGSQLRVLGRQRLVRDCLVALAGGAVGAGLLLAGGDRGFKQVVPWLVLLASVMLVAQPRLTRSRGEVDSPRAYLAGLALTCVYGGYFGAGAGVVFMLLALFTTSVGFRRSVMLKSLLVSTSNLAASVIFVLLAPINWWAALAMGIGCFAGGRCGPWLQRRIPVPLLRWAVALGGVVLAVWLWTKG